MKRIYLDNNATTRPHDEVIEAVTEAMGDYGNPSSLHWFGQVASARVDDAREQVASAIGSSPGEVHFCGGGTEANNGLIRGAAYSLADKGRHIVSTAIEHPSVLAVLADLERRGFRTTLVPAGESGRVDPEAVREALADDTILVSAMAANNETGVTQPIREIGAMARERGILFHTDAVQLVGKRKLDLAELPVDLLSSSAHKFYGPKGVGFFYVRRGVSVPSRMLGGGQEFGMRGGTENVPGIAGLAAAARMFEESLDDWAEEVSALRDRLETRLLSALDDALVNGDRARRVFNTTNISFMGAEGEAVALTLDLKGVAVSTGSACGAAGAKHGSILSSMGLPRPRVNCAIRFSLGADNTEAEIEEAADLVIESVKRVRSIGG